MRNLPQNIGATMEGHPYRGWVPPTLGQTQQYSVLCVDYLKTSKQQ